LERAEFQSFHPNRDSIAVPVHQLQPIQSAIEKQKQITATDIPLELGLHKGGKAVETAPHVRWLGVKKNADLTRGERW
jgi:hypothetical protein